MSSLQKTTVLVTGGANGIGKLMGEESLKRGASKLIIWDINEDNLEKTTEELSDKGYDVYPYFVDVSDLEDINFAANDVLQRIGIPDILINNAGIVVGKQFHEHSTRDIDKTIQINVLGVMHTTRAFLPDMIARGSGHLVNIASASSYLANPNMSVYAASKWAVMGWSETVRLELEAINKNLRVTTIAPSYINTGMFDGVTAPLMTPILEPAYIVGKIMSAIEKNQILVIEPPIAKTLPLLKGALPTRAFDYLAKNVFKVYNSMDHFQGRVKEEAVPEKKIQNTKHTPK